MSRSATRNPKRQQQKPARKPGLPSVALCVIARNEEDFIGQCLDSARPFVDEIVVVDTGSTDCTREIVAEHGARIEEFAWCDDFAAARNAAIEAATADWILMLDADEELDPTSGPLLKKLAAELPEGMIAYAISIENRRLTDEESIIHSVIRFFPRRAELRFMGAIHEDLCYLPDPAAGRGMFAPSIRIVHYGYDPAVYAAKAKDERNMQLLQREIERHPEDVRMVYHLGQQHFVAGRHRAAAEAFERFAQAANRLAPYFLVDAYRMWIESVITLGDDDRLTALTQQAEAAGVLSALSREMLALHDLRRGRLTSAKRHLLCALDAQAPAGIAAPPGTGGWRSHLLLAETYDKLGQREAALVQLQEAFVELPERLRHGVAVQGVNLATRMGQSAERDWWLLQAGQAAPGDLHAHQALLHMILEALRRDPALVGEAVAGPLERALAAEEWQTAYDLALALPLGSPEALARIVFLADQLREQRAAEAALDLLGRAVAVYEPSKQLYWTLVQTLKDLDRFDDALSAIEILRTLEDSEETLQKAA